MPGGDVPHRLRLRALVFVQQDHVAIEPVGREGSAMTLDSNQFFDWCMGAVVLVFAAGMLFVAFSAGVLP